MTIQQIVDKQKEIDHYIGVLERYQSGRWYNMGKRHLEQLHSELDELIMAKDANETNETKRVAVVNSPQTNLQIASLMGMLGGVGLLDEFDSMVERYTPAEKEKVNRTDADIAERKAKQEAKLARRAKRNA